MNNENNQNNNDFVDSNFQSQSQPQSCLNKIKNYIKIPQIRIEKIIRLILFISITTFMIVNLFFGQAIAHYNVYCINDMTHIWTNEINKFLYNSKWLNYIIKSIFSILIDLSIIYTLIVWSLFSKNIRLLSTGITYMIINLAARFIFIRVQPINASFYLSSFPSIFVNYQKTSYSFFSVVIGLLIICAFEWKRNNNIFFFWFFIGLFIFGLIFITISQGHYFYEIFSATIIGHYSFIINEFVLTKIYGENYLKLPELSIANGIGNKNNKELSYYSDMNHNRKTKSSDKGVNLIKEEEEESLLFNKEE